MGWCVFKCLNTASVALTLAWSFISRITIISCMSCCGNRCQGDLYRDEPVIMVRLTIDKHGQGNLGICVPIGKCYVQMFLTLRPCLHNPRSFFTEVFLHLYQKDLRPHNEISKRSILSSCHGDNMISAQCGSNCTTARERGL